MTSASVGIIVTVLIFGFGITWKMISSLDTRISKIEDYLFRKLKTYENNLVMDIKNLKEKEKNEK